VGVRRVDAGSRVLPSIGDAAAREIDEARFETGRVG
jgi:hypothetical protein